MKAHGASVASGTTKNQGVVAFALSAMAERAPSLLQERQGPQSSSGFRVRRVSGLGVMEFCGLGCRSLGV